MYRTPNHKTVQNRGECLLIQKFRDVTYIRIEEKNFWVPFKFSNKYLMHICQYSSKIDALGIFISVPGNFSLTPVARG